MQTLTSASFESAFESASLGSVSLGSVSLESVVQRILSSRQITRKDQHLLLSLYTLTSQEQNLINQVFDRLRMGLLRVVD